MKSINSEQVAFGLPMKDCIDSMEDLFRSEAGFVDSQPQRTISRIDENSLIMTMPGYSKKLGRFAVKVVSEYRRNPDLFHLKIQGGAVMLFDSINSELLAVIDSPRLTSIRTGAVSALSTKLLSRKDSQRVGLIGSGEQARAILEGITCVRRIERAFVYSRDFSHANTFAGEMSAKLGVSIQPVRTLIELRKCESDILVVSTNSSLPVLKWTEDVASGMHINSIGTLPDRRELDAETVCKSRLFVDTKRGVLSEAGDVMDSIRRGLMDSSQIVGDLSDLLLGRVAGRLSVEDVTLFKSVGFSLQDVYASNRLYENFKGKN